MNTGQEEQAQKIMDRRVINKYIHREGKEQDIIRKWDGKGLARGGEGMSDSVYYRY